MLKRIGSLLLPITHAVHSIEKHPPRIYSYTGNTTTVTAGVQLNQQGHFMNVTSAY